MHNPDCIFCKIAKGEAPSNKIWENDEYMAFLSIFPNTEGFTVVIPKKHYESYAFKVPEDVLLGLVKASREVGLLLDSAFDDVGRTGMVLEGFGVNHLHSKLFPMHGTRMEGWKPIKSNVRTYFERYEGFISSHDSERADDSSLRKTAEKIRKAGIKK